MTTAVTTITATSPARSRRATATATVAPTPATAAAPTRAPVAPPTSPAAKPTTKSDTVIKLLLRGKGATPTELIAATDWQPHSLRAFLSDLRKKGRVIVREARKGGGFAYRIVVAATEAVATPDVVREGAVPDTSTVAPGMASFNDAVTAAAVA